MDAMTVRAVLLACAALLAVAPAVARAAPGEFTTYPVPDRTAPFGIVTGPDGNLWFTGRGTIGRLTPDGSLKTFPLPDPAADAHHIAAGAEHLFFTEYGTSRVGRIGLDGEVIRATTQTCPPATCGLRWANGIAVAPDGSPWYSVDEVFGTGAEEDPGYHEVCTSTADLEPVACTTVDHYTAGPNGHATGGPVLGPDGAMWFTNKFERFIGRMATDGDRTVTRFELPKGSDPERITPGPDGALWFADGNQRAIGRITVAGVVRFFALPERDRRPLAITTGPDGAVWFTVSGDAPDALGRITPEGKVTYFPIPDSESGPAAITTGPDGALWFTQPGADRIGRFEPPAPPAPAPAPSPEPSPTPSPEPQPSAPQPGPAAETGTPPPATEPRPGPPRLVSVRSRRGRLAVKLSAAGTVEVRIRRARGSGRTVSRRRHRVRGSARIRLRARPGRYVVIVTPLAADGARGRSRTLRVTLRRARKLG